MPAIAAHQLARSRPSRASRTATNAATTRRTNEASACHRRVVMHRFCMGGAKTHRARRPAFRAPGETRPLACVRRLQVDARGTGEWKITWRLTQSAPIGAGGRPPAGRAQPSGAAPRGTLILSRCVGNHHCQQRWPCCGHRRTRPGRAGQSQFVRGAGAQPVLLPRASSRHRPLPFALLIGVHPRRLVSPLIEPHRVPWLLQRSRCRLPRGAQRSRSPVGIRQLKPSPMPRRAHSGREIASRRS